MSDVEDLEHVVMVVMVKHLTSTAFRVFLNVKELYIIGFSR